MEIEVNINDQLYVNNKWYFDVTNINDNILQVRIQYKENPNINNYIYKHINFDYKLIDKIEKTNGLIYCTIDEKKLRNVIGNLINRIKVEPNYSFLFEDGSGGDGGGFGDISMPGLSGVPGVPGSAGSGDISNTSLASSYIKPIDLFGERPKKKKKRKVKAPFIKIESIDNSLNEVKTIILEIIEYPELNSTDTLFIDDIIIKKDILMNSGIDTIIQYFNDLININKSLYNSCSDYIKNKINNIINHE